MHKGILYIVYMFISSLTLWIIFYFIDKPELTVTPPLSQTVNESVNIRFQCNATGVPKPLIIWTKDDIVSNILHYGEVFWLYNIRYQQKGTYYCTASNRIGNTTASSILLVNRKFIMAIEVVVVDVVK